MARAIGMALTLVMASAVVQAGQCSSGGECLSDDVAKSVTSLIQTNVQMDILKDAAEDASKDASAQEPKEAKTVMQSENDDLMDEPASAQQQFVSVLKLISTMWQRQYNVAATAAADPITLAVGEPLNKTAMYREMALCIVAVLLIISIVVFLYWRLGVFIIKVLIYLLALSAIRATIKVVVDANSFKFPLFLTAVHFGCSAIIGFALLLYNSWSNSVEIEKPSRQVFGTSFCPVAVAFAAEVGMDNMALVYSTSAFCEIVEACDPIATVLMILALQKPFDMKLLAPICVVLIGCALTVNGEKGFSMLGFILVVGSSFPHAYRAVFQAELLCQQDANAKVYSPVAVLAWTCLPAAVAMLIWSFLQEGTMPYHQIYGQGLLSQLTIAISLCTVNACILNISMLFVVKDLGAVATQIVAQTKAILVFLCSIFVLKENVSGMDFVGYVVILAGVYAYNHLDSDAEDPVSRASSKQSIQ